MAGGQPTAHNGCFGGSITGDRIRRPLGDHVVERDGALDAIDGRPMLPLVEGETVKRWLVVKHRAISLVAAACIDFALGEPPAHYHPVALVGRLLALGTDRHVSCSARRQLVGGATALAGTVVLAAIAGATVEHVLKCAPAGPLGSAVALKPLFAARMLVEEAGEVGMALERGDLDVARERLGSLVSRPTEDLTGGLVAAAAIESLAENLGDSVVAPWLYYTGLGLPGAAIYRVVDTADSMYGYRGDKEWLGKAAAHTDDALSWVPSRLAAAAIVGAARLRLGSAAAASALEVWRTDGSKTQSPNAGRPMAAMAGALQRRLEKRDHYVLGWGFPEPTPHDVRRAMDLTVAASGIALIGLAGLLVLTP